MIRFLILLVIPIAMLATVVILVRLGYLKKPNKRLDEAREQLEENRLLDEILHPRERTEVDPRRRTK